MSGVLRWEEPPEAYHRAEARQPNRSKHWRQVAVSLREQPCRWAVVLEGATFTHTGGIARQIKRGVIAAFRPSGHFEAQTRTTPAGYTVYARYVGEGS
jgi:hypothetical protein